MPKLVLVKHSNSNHNSQQAAADWALTAAGIERCKPLAHHLAVYQPRRLFSSPMPKALQTAQTVSQELDDLPIIVNQALAEHSRRSNAPYGTLAGFNARIRRLFEEPDELAFGDETANQARQRFQGGIETLLKNAAKEENIVVIAHGTVMVLFAAQYNPLDSYALWQKLKLPSLIVLDLPSFRISEVIEDAGTR